jgi:hypothetical protein
MPALHSAVIPDRSQFLAELSKSLQLILPNASDSHERLDSARFPPDVFMERAAINLPQGTSAEDLKVAATIVSRCVSAQALVNSASPIDLVDTQTEAVLNFLAGKPFLYSKAARNNFEGLSYPSLAQRGTALLDCGEIFYPEATSEARMSYLLSRVASDMFAPRLAVITDVHWGPPPSYPLGQMHKLTEYSEAVVRAYTSMVKNRLAPLASIQLGDLVEDIGFTHHDNAQAFLEAHKILSSSCIPTLNAAGNHEAAKIPSRLLEALFGYSNLYYSFDLPHLHIVVLDSTSKEEPHSYTEIGEEQLRWLADDLATSKNPAIVFVHHPLIEPDLSQNVWFSNNRRGACVSNRDEVLSVLSASGKVSLVVSGHLHQNAWVCQNGINQLVLQSPIERSFEKDIPESTFALIDLESEDFSVWVFGTSEARYRAPRA